MLCLGGRIAEYQQSVASWKDRVDWLGQSPLYRELVRIGGEPIVFGWMIFPGLKDLTVLVEDFKDRSIFMSMYNDIDWGQKDNEGSCKRNSSSVANMPKKFLSEIWSFLGPGCEENGTVRSPISQMVHDGTKSPKK